MPVMGTTSDYFWPRVLAKKGGGWGREMGHVYKRGLISEQLHLVRMFRDILQNYSP